MVVVVHRWDHQRDRALVDLGVLRGGDGGSCAGSGFFGSLVSFGSCDMDHYLFQFCGDNPIFPESSTRQRSIEIAEFAE